MRMSAYSLLSLMMSGSPILSCSIVLIMIASTDSEDAPPSLLVICFRCLMCFFVGLCFCIGQLLQIVIPIITTCWWHPLLYFVAQFPIAFGSDVHRLQSGFIVINK